MPRRNPSSKHAQRRAKGKGSGNSRTEVEEPGGTAHQFLCTEEVGTPKGRALIGELFFSLLKSGKLKACWKKAKGKLKASER